MNGTNSPTHPRFHYWLLLPGGWPRADARELFIGCYDLLGPPAALRVRQIITRYSPELADRAAYHSSELKLSAAPVVHT